MRHVSVFLLLSLSSASVALMGCTDPNPTFVFDAAPAVRDGGTDGGDGSVEAGAPQNDTDGGTDAAGEAR